MDESTSGRKVVQAIVERYTRFSTYQDRGILRVFQKGDPLPWECEFATSYAAPDLFRFAFVRPHPYYPLRHIKRSLIVGCKGSSAYLKLESRGIGQLRVMEDLAHAVGVANGVTMGALYTIARLLRPDVGGLFLDALENVMVAQSMDNGCECYWITGRHPSGEYWEVTAERATLLVRMLVRRGACDMSAETRNDLRVDEEIALERFDVPG